MKRFFFTSVATVCFCYSFSQNVGIGTTTPTKAKLEVHGVGSSGNTNAIFGGSSSGISFQQNWPTIGFNQYRDNTVGNGRFMSTGYAAIQYLDPGSGAMLFDMLGTGTGGNLTTSGTRALTILNNGNIGIRSGGSSSASLFINKSGNFDGSAVFAGTSYWSHFNYGVPEHTYIRAGKANGNVYINDITGGKVAIGNGTNTFVGINSSDPQYPLEIRQVPISDIWEKGLVLVSPMHNWDAWEIHATSNLVFSYNEFVKGYISPTSGAYSATSDARLKTNIRPLPSLLDKVKSLVPLRYEFKDNNPQHLQSIGFLAQDVKLLFPELVSVVEHSGNGHNIDNLHLLDYSGFGVIAIKAIQEQQAIIDTQAKKIDALEARLERLEKLLATNK